MMKKAMILGTYNDAPYHPFAGVDRALKDLLSPDFDVTLTDDPARLNGIMRDNEQIPFFFITGKNRMAPAEIQATFEFATPEIVGQGNGIIVWRLRRKPAPPDSGKNGEQSVPS